MQMSSVLPLGAGSVQTETRHDALSGAREIVVIACAGASSHPKESTLSAMAVCRDDPASVQIVAYVLTQTYQYRPDPAWGMPVFGPIAGKTAYHKKPRGLV